MRRIKGRISMVLGWTGKEAQFHVPIIQVFLSHSEKTTISPVRQWSDESNKDPEQ